MQLKVFEKIYEVWYKIYRKSNEERKEFSIMKNCRTNALKSKKGITLIALVITIIVLLILAGISISMLAGDNGILQKVTIAKENTDKTQIEERIKLAYHSALAGGQGNYTKDTLEDELEKEFGDDFEEVDDSDDTNWILKAKGQSVTVPAGKNEDAYIFNEEELIIGNAINTNKYGYKVNTYTSSDESGYNGIWRLFYQDENLTYIITDEGQGNYNLNSVYNSYNNGASVGTIGKRLNSKINSLFIEENTKANIKGIAFFTDSTRWDKYKDNEGDAVCVIASPTLELFIASYNGVAKIDEERDELKELEYDEYGYTSVLNNIVDNNHGIYNGSYWIASPFSISSSQDTFYFYSCNVGGSVGGSYPPMWTSQAVRPIVCVPTKKFEKKYIVTDE